jgi:hypothetical protein
VHAPLLRPAPCAGECTWSAADEEPRVVADASATVLERLRPAAQAYRIDVAGRRADVLIST